jgi:hypothetical protein
MKAVLLMGHGGFDQLGYRVDVPVPALRADEVLVKVGAAAVNNTDINTRTAWYSKGVKKERPQPALRMGMRTRNPKTQVGPASRRFSLAFRAPTPVAASSL